MSLSFFFGIGEFVEANPGAAVTLLIAVIALIAYIVRIEVQGRQTRLDVDEMHNSLTHHLADKDAHVNTLYMRTIENRLDKIEDTMTTQHENLAAKVERGVSEIKAVVGGLRGK